MWCAVLTKCMVLCNEQYRPSVWCYVMSGTERTYGVVPALLEMSRAVLRGRLSGELSAYARATPCFVLSWRMVLSAYARAMRSPVLT
eukprot:3935448-Rhodomonas_salina.1